MLSSGQSVQILGRKGKWSHIRLAEDGANNKEGWVMSRYLISRVPWKLQATSMRAKNTSLKKKLATTEKNLNGVALRERNLSSKLQTSTKALDGLRMEFERLKRGAAGYLKLKAAHKVTTSKFESIQNEVQGLRAENAKLRSSQRNKWFAIGALVFLCGSMIGLVFGRQQRRQRSSYY